MHTRCLLFFLREKCLFVFTFLFYRCFLLTFCRLLIFCSFPSNGRHQSIYIKKSSRSATRFRLITIYERFSTPLLPQFLNICSLLIDSMLRCYPVLGIFNHNFIVGTRNNLSISFLSSNFSNNRNLTFHSKSIKSDILPTSELNGSSPLTGLECVMMDYLFGKKKATEVAHS